MSILEKMNVAEIWILYFFAFIIVVSLLILAVLAFVRNDNKLRTTAIIILVTILLVRELSVKIYSWIILSSSEKVENLTNEFTNGVQSTLNYWYKSAILVVPLLIIMTVICIRGFYNKGIKKAKKQNSSGIKSFRLSWDK